MKRYFWTLVRQMLVIFIAYVAVIWAVWAYVSEDLAWFLVWATIFATILATSYNLLLIRKILRALRRR